MVVELKTYVHQEPPYLMRQICVLQWEEIKTKNSGATHHFEGKRAQGVESEYIAIVFPILTREPKIISICSNLIY